MPVDDLGLPCAGAQVCACATHNYVYGHTYTSHKMKISALRKLINLKENQVSLSVL